MKLVNASVSSDSSFSSWYHEIFYEKADPRVRDRWLMGDPMQILLIYGFYIIFIQYILPKFMENKKPFDIDKAAVALNSTLFLSCLFFFYQGFVPWFSIFSWRCEPMDWSESELAVLVSF